MQNKEQQTTWRNDLQKQKEHNKKYYALHKEKLKEAAKAWHKNNLERSRKYRREWYWKNKESKNIIARARISGFKYRYGMSPADYDVLYQKQDGKCAICVRDNKKLMIDHSHITGKIRALLCPRCNGGLGYIEDITFITKAKQYLKDHMDS